MRKRAADRLLGMTPDEVKAYTDFRAHLWRGIDKYLAKQTSTLPSIRALDPKRR